LHYLATISFASQDSRFLKVSRPLKEIRLGDRLGSKFHRDPLFFSFVKKYGKLRSLTKNALALWAGWRKVKEDLRDLFQVIHVRGISLQTWLVVFTQNGKYRQFAPAEERLGFTQNVYRMLT